MLLSAFYDLSLITATGQQTSTGDKIDSIASLVSINDSATAAYVANVSGPAGTGTAVIVDDAQMVGGTASAPVKISFENPILDRVFAFPQINNAGLVAVRDRLLGPVTDSYVRTWDSNNPGTYNIVAASTDGVFDSVTLPTLSNGGSMAFIGFAGGFSQTGLYFNELPQRGADVFLSDVTGSGGVWPMMSEFDQIALRKGTDENGSIQVVDASDHTKRTIASTSSGYWATLGNAPALSDQGRPEVNTASDAVVVFYGDLTAAGANAINAANGDVVPVPVAPGPGVFAAVPIGGAYHIVRVAGESGNGNIDPGERRPLNTMNDVGPDFDYDGAADWQIGMGGFVAGSRSGITNFQPFDDPTKGSYATVVYLANDTVGTVGPAIYTSRLNLFKDASGNFSSVGVEAPIQVAKVGDNVGGFGTIQDIGALYDAINNNGQIAFWVSNGTKQAVVQADRDLTVNDLGPAGQNRPRFDPDSPLVEYVVAGEHANQNTRNPINQIVLHAVADRERGGLHTLTMGTVPSVHYLVSREGRVTQIIREADVANQAPPANHNSIGIELVDDTLYTLSNGKPVVVAGTGHLNDPNWLTPVQRKKAALLVRDIALRNGIYDANQTIQHLVGTNDPNFVPQAFERAVPLTPGTTAAVSGIARTHTGILAHGQVLNRTAGRTDPQNFPDGATSPGTSYHWSTFMAQVNNGIGLTLNSPANLLVTDPMGRRVGVDPTNGQTLVEIPGATFTGPGTEPQSITIPGGMDGQYQVQVVGTADGVFHLDLYAASRAGEFMWTQVADQTSAGMTASYTLNYTTAVEAQSTVTAAANLPPVAFDDEFFTRGAGAVPMPVLAGDTDPEGLLDVSSVTVVQPPLSGMASVDPGTGIITYTPNAGFVGDDSFQYDVRDTAGSASDIATVIIHVLRETEAPVAGDDDVTTPFDTPVVIDVLANDSDPDGTLEPGTVEISHDGEPQNGFVTIDPLTGRITYTPDPESFGTETFKYFVLDNDLANSNEATVTVTVLPPEGPEVSVTGNGEVILAGDTTPDLLDHTDFGLASQNQLGPLYIFTVRNVGPATLTLGPVSVPAGFTVVEPLVGSLDPGEEDTFAVQLNTSALGTFSGPVTFSTNDSNENPFSFSVTGTVSIVPGSPDLTFGGGDGRVITAFSVGSLDIASSARSVAIQPDGKILVGGDGDNQSGFLLARYEPDGDLDPTFGDGDGRITTGFGNTFARGEKVLLEPDGKIMLVGIVSSTSGVSVGLAQYNSDGTLDNTFNGSGRATGFLGVSSLDDAALQPDGKVVVIWSFDGHGRDFAVARFNADGTPDTSFDGDGIATTDLTPNSSISNDVPMALVVQPDGKIVIAGAVTGGEVGDPDYNVGLVRYNPDGSLDTTFGEGDGIVLTSLLSTLHDVALQPDEKIVVVTGGGAALRYNADGTLDASFSGDGLVPLDGFVGKSVLIQSDGKVLLAGNRVITTEDGTALGVALVRLLPDGSLDAAFNEDGTAFTVFLGHPLEVEDAVLQPDGKIVVAGLGGGFHVGRFQNDLVTLPLVTLAATDAVGSEQGSDGMRFTVTRTGATDDPLTVFFEVQNDGAAGQATLGSDFELDGGMTQVTIPAGASSADIDVSVLSDAAIEEDELVTIAIVQSPTYSYFIGVPFIADGLIQGECQQVALDGTLDPTFGGGDGLVSTDFEVGQTFTSSLALQPDGKVLVASRGPANVVAVARYRSNGIPDPSFDNDGLIITPLELIAGIRPSVAVQPDGKIIVAGLKNGHFAMARYYSNGALDTTFGGGDGLVEANIGGGLQDVLIQPDGKILLAGGSGADFAVARYNADGSLDSTFGVDGAVNTDVGPGNNLILDVAIDPDGKIVAAGTTDFNDDYIDYFAPGADWAMVRYNPDGSLDTTFGGTGVVITSIDDSAKARAVAVLPNGKILVAGSAFFKTPTVIKLEAVLGRYNPDGSLDTSFGGGDGLVLDQEVVTWQALAAQPDGRIVVVGECVCGFGAPVVARFDADGTSDPTFGEGNGMIVVPGVQTVGYAGAAIQPDGKLVFTFLRSPASGLEAGFHLGSLTGPCLVGESPASFNGVVFDDADGDGSRDTGEPGLMGWEVRAYADLNGNGLLDADELAAGVSDSGTTDANGAYALNLAAGDYIVVEVSVTGWHQSFPVVSVNTLDATLGEFGHAISLGSGQVSTGNDFGNFGLGSLHGQKFHDLNGNGVHDAGEPGLDGWTIQLLDETGSVVATMVTTSMNLNGDQQIDPETERGLYWFTDLGTGTYTVAEASAFSGLVVFGDSLSDTGNVFLGTAGAQPPSPPYFNGRFADGPVWVEDLAAQLGLPAPTPSLAGGTNFAFGGAETGQGTSTLGSPNIGSQIDMFLAAGSFTGSELVALWGGPDDFLSAGTTDPTVPVANLADDIARLAAAGAHSFVVPNLPPLGQTPRLRGTPEEAAADALSVQFNTLLDAAFDDLETNLGITIFRIDVFALVQSALADPAAFGLTNVTDPACVGCETGTPMIVPNPDEYLFWDTIHGTTAAHTIFGGIAAEAVQSAWLQTYPAAPGTHTVTLADGESAENLDFGNAQPVSIHGQKFEDLNGDGVHDASEPGLDGWTIALRDETGSVATTLTMSIDLNGDGQINPETEQGLYGFDGLLPGTYQLREVLEAGWVQSFPAEAGTQSTTLTSGQVAEGLDFGNFRGVVLGGTKFEDSNRDGRRDDGEKGLEGWTIQLDLDSDGTIDQTTTTDRNGEYSFDDIGPGTHTILELQQPGYAQTFPGGDGVYTITTTSGQDVSKLDFGNAVLVAGAPVVQSLPAVVRGNQWHLRGSLSSGPADIMFTFGLPGDVPLFGDWNGDGVKTPGVFRDGVWFLRNSNTSGPGEIAFAYGLPGDQPVAGDWDGDGIDTPGVVRGGLWFLRNSNTSGAGEMAFAYGLPGDRPVVGDWDGDGTDTPGVMREAADSVWWLLRNHNTSGIADEAFDYGLRGDFPVMGDWNGDGITTVGVARELFVDCKEPPPRNPLGELDANWAVRQRVDRTPKPLALAWLVRNTNETALAEHGLNFGLPSDYPLVWGMPVEAPGTPNVVDAALGELLDGSPAKRNTD